MNNALVNLVRCALPAVMLAMSSAAMSQEANSQDTKRITLAQAEAREAVISQSETKSFITEEPRLCSQGNDLASCESAATVRFETKNEGATPMPPIFDLKVLLGGNAP